MGESITSCKVCGRSFLSTGIQKLCPKCTESVEVDLKTIIDFLYENKGKSGLGIREISDGTGVKTHVIRYLVREKRLDITGGSGGLTCSICRRPIRHGSLCENCKNAFIKRVERQEKQKEKPAEKQVDSSNKKVMKIHIDINGK